ncbi:Kininogen-1 [Manis pentadactyla]|nr:Kininogen-1 [Manis pentadactyla]
MSWMVRQEEKELVKWVKGRGIPGEGCRRTQMQSSQSKEGLRRSSGACGSMWNGDAGDLPKLYHGRAWEKEVYRTAQLL